MSNMIISTNMAALNSHRNIKRVGKNITKAAEKLSSGLKINSASDDAAGLSISEKMRSQILGLDRAELNSVDGESLIQVADGAMQEAHNMIHRMRELAIYACNDTNTDEDRAKLNEEYAQLADEVAQLAEKVEFNKKKLLSGDYAEWVFKELVIDVDGAIKDSTPVHKDNFKVTVGMSPLPNRVTDPYTVPAQVLVPADTMISSGSVTAILNPASTATVNNITAANTTVANSYKYSHIYVNTSGASTTTITDNHGGQIETAKTGVDTLVVANNRTFDVNLDGDTYTYTTTQYRRSSATVDGTVVYTVTQIAQRADTFSIFDDYINQKQNQSFTGGTITGSKSVPRNLQLNSSDTVGTDSTTNNAEQIVTGAAFPAVSPSPAGANAPGSTYTGIFYTYTNKTWNNGSSSVTDAGTTYATEPNRSLVTDTQALYDHNIHLDEYERAEIISYAATTRVNANQGMVYVSNSAAGASTVIGANASYTKYGYAERSYVDTNTQFVQITSNTATLYARNASAGSVLTGGNAATGTGFTNNRPGGLTDDVTRGYIYTSAETVALYGTNSGDIYVDRNNANNSVFDNVSTTVLTTNSGTLYTDSFKTEVRTNNSNGVITTFNNSANSSFSAGVNDSGVTVGANNAYGRITTAAYSVTVNANGSTNTSHLRTTNTDAGSKLTLTQNFNGSFVVATTGNVDITTNNGSVLLENTVNDAKVANTTATSHITSNALKLTLTGTVNGGDVRVVTAGGRTNELVIAAGAVVSANTVIYMEAGTKLTIQNGATFEGKVIFTDSASVTADNPLNANVPNNQNVLEILGTASPVTTGVVTNGATGVIKLVDGANFAIETNNGRVDISGYRAVGTNDVFTDSNNTHKNSAGHIGVNNGTVVNGNTNLTGAVTTVETNNGVIDNYGYIEVTENNGLIRHHAYDIDVSGIEFPSVTGGVLDPPEQAGVLKFKANGIEYYVEAYWQDSTGSEGVHGDCDCPIGVFPRNSCLDTARGVLPDTFTLVFDLKSAQPPLSDPVHEMLVFDELDMFNRLDIGLAYEYGGVTATLGASNYAASPQDITRTGNSFTIVRYGVDASVYVDEVWEEGEGIYIQLGANSRQGTTLYIPKIGSTFERPEYGCVFCDCGTLQSGNLLTRENATATLGICDFATDNISTARAKLGAQENRLVFSGRLAATASLNMSASMSRLRDADMAKEMMNLTKSKVLFQAGAAMLAQSNSAPRNVMDLIG